jgi:hypothetical protein
MQRLLMLSATTRVNRHAVMQQINDLVVSRGGWIEGHTLFSNIAATFRFVLPAGRLKGFAEAVDGLGVHIDAAASRSRPIRSRASPDWSCTARSARTGR